MKFRLGKYSVIPSALAVRFLLLSLSFCFILSGCAFARLATVPFEKPVFTFLQGELVETSQKHALVNFHFSAHNPNNAGLKNTKISYELYIEGKQLLNGTDIPFELIPNGDTEIIIPASIVYRDLYPLLGPLVKRIVSGKKTIPMTIVVVFSGKPVMYTNEGEERMVPFERRLTKTIDIPLIKERSGTEK